MGLGTNRNMELLRQAQMPATIKTLKRKSRVTHNLVDGVEVLHVSYGIGKKRVQQLMVKASALVAQQKKGE